MNKRFAWPKWHLILWCGGLDVRLPLVGCRTWQRPALPAPWSFHLSTKSLSIGTPKGTYGLVWLNSAHVPVWLLGYDPWDTKYGRGLSPKFWNGMRPILPWQSLKVP